MATGNSQYIPINLQMMLENVPQNKLTIDELAKQLGEVAGLLAMQVGIKIDPNTVNTVRDLEKLFAKLNISATQTENAFNLLMSNAKGLRGNITGIFDNEKGSFSVSEVSLSEQRAQAAQNLNTAYKDLTYTMKKMGLATNQNSEYYQELQAQLGFQQQRLQELRQLYAETYQIKIGHNKTTKEETLLGQDSLAIQDRRLQKQFELLQAEVQTKQAEKQELEVNKQHTQEINKYVSALKEQWVQEEKLVRLKTAKAPEEIIEEQRKITNASRSHAQQLKKEVETYEEYKNISDETAYSEQKHAQKLRELSAAGQKTNSIFGTFKNTLKQVIQAGLSWKIFSFMTQTLQKSIDTVKELNANLTDLRIVTGATNEEAEQMLDTYNEMAKTLGATTQEVAEASVGWLRQGYSIEESNELLKQSMILSKVGMVESAQAAQYLTSAIKGYKVETAEASKIVDMATAIDMKAAVSAGDLFEALSKTANLAHMMGIEMNEAFAMIAGGMEVTQQSASSFGNAMKTLLSRMSSVAAGKTIDDMGESLNNVESTLKEQGIALRTSTNEWRKFYNVLDEIAAKVKSGELSGVALSKVTTAIGGTRQREAIVTILENWEKIKQYADIASDSMGTSAEKFAIYTESIEGKINTLKSSFVEFSRNIIQSDLIKSFVDLGQITLNVANSDFAQLVIKTSALFIAFKGIAIVLTKLIKAINKMNLVFGKQGTLLTNLRNGVLLLKKGEVELSKTIKESTANWNDLSEAERKELIQKKKNAAISSWVNLSLTALAVTVGIVTTAIEKYKQHQEEVYQQAKQNIESIVQEQDQLTDLIKQYTTLAKQDLQDSSNREAIRNLQQQIVNLVGKEAAGIDLVNGKLKEQINLLQTKAVEKAKKDLPSLKADWDIIESKFGQSIESYSGWTPIWADVSKFKKVIFDLYKEENSKIDPNRIFNVITQGISYSNAYDVNNYEYINSIEKVREQLKTFEQVQEDIVSNKDKFGESTYLGAVSEIKKVIKQYTELIETYDKAETAYTKTWAIVEEGNTKISSRADVEAAYQKYTDKSKYSDSQRAAILEVLNEKLELYTLITGQAIDANGELIKSTKTLEEAENDLADAKERLTEAQKELNETQQQYKVVIGAVVDACQEEIDKLNSLKDAYKDFIATQEDQLATYDMAIEYGNRLIDEEIAGLEAQKSAIQNSNEARKEAIRLQELEINLKKAQNQLTMRTYTEEKGWHWVADPEAVANAQKALDGANADRQTAIQIAAIDAEIAKKQEFQQKMNSIPNGLKEEELEQAFIDTFGSMAGYYGVDYEKFKNQYQSTQKNIEAANQRIEELDTQIAKVKELQEQWKSVPVDYEKAQNKILALTILANKGITEETNLLAVAQTSLSEFQQSYKEEIDSLTTKVNYFTDAVNAAILAVNILKGQAGSLSSNEKVIDSRGTGTRTINKYASGTLSSAKGLALVDEQGIELRVPPQGHYQALEAGTGILPHDLTERLFNLAINPIEFISKFLPLLNNNAFGTNNNSSKVINISNINLPSVNNAEDFVKQLQIIAANR